MNKSKKEKKWTYVNKWYIILPFIFLLVIYLIPLVRMLWLSICDEETGQYTLQYFADFFSDPYYIGILTRTITLSLWSVVFCIIMGYPIAYKIAHMTGIKRSIATTFLVLPLWVSIMIRMFGWMAILPKSGVFSIVLQALHIIDEPMNFLGSDVGVIMGLIHCGLPYFAMIMISPIENVDTCVEEASYVFGAGFIKTFFKVTLPLTLPGIISGALLVFALNTAAFMVPVMLGGGKVMVMTNMIYQQTMFIFDWSFAAALSVILLVVSMLIVSLSSFLSNKLTIQD